MLGRTISHYEVLERIGSGGMGDVYKAHDQRLDRIVALKFLPAELSRDPDVRRRFTREAQAASALDHPNLCTVHEIDESEDGQPFMAMAFYSGQTLAKRLREGPLDLGEALNLAIQMTEGLGAAHRAGIVHRDLKPGNVILGEDGLVKILDFGIAKLRDRTTLTRTGSTIGTAAYMPPEQVLGLDVDGRSDLWSVGVVLQEMVTGKLPFSGRYEQAQLYAIVNQEPQLPRSQNPDLPEALDDVVGRALRKDPDLRHQNAEELLVDLRALATGGRPVAATPAPAPTPERALPAVGPRRWALAGAVALVAAVAWFAAPDDAPTPRATSPTLAVLPFANLTGDPELGHLGPGIAAGLAARLGEVSALRLLGRSGVQRLLDGTAAPGELAGDLGVTSLLEGQIQGRPDGLQVTVQLTDVTTGIVELNKSFEGSAGDLLALQARIAEELTALLAISLSPGERQRLARDPTRSYPAYDLYLKGELALEDVTDSARGERAAALYRQALRLDPDFALANAGLAGALWVAYHADRDRELLVEAERQADRALELDPDLMEGRLALAVIHRSTGRPDESLATLQQVLASHPEPAEIHRQLALTYEQVGDLEEAERSLTAALALDPTSWRSLNHLGSLQLTLGRYGDARESYQAAAEAAPESAAWPRENLAALELLEGRFDAAIDALEAIPPARRDAELWANLGTAYFFSERPDRWERAEDHYGRAVRLAPDQPHLRGNLADLYHQLGREEEALGEYDRALRLVDEQLLASPGSPALRLQRAFYAAKARRCEAATALADELAASLAESAASAHTLALTYALCERRDGAVQQLEIAIRLGFAAEMVRSEPEFAPLAGDPEFSRLVGEPP